MNELIDQRDQLVRTLGELVGATAMPSEDGMVSVTVGGIMVVAEGHAVPLTLTGGTAISAVSPPSSDPPVICWGNVAVPVDAGEAAGLLAALRTDLPAVSASVDGVAVALRDAVNLLHGGGYTLDGTPGGDFFTGEGAADLAVAPTSGTQIAVSASAGDADGSNAAAIGDLSLDAIAAEVLDQIGGGAGPSVRWRDLTSALGVKVQGLQRAEAVQVSVVAAADNAVESDAWGQPGRGDDQHAVVAARTPGRRPGDHDGGRDARHPGEPDRVSAMSTRITHTALSTVALRSQQAGTEQYLRNIDDATGRLNVADDALTQVSSLLCRARELVLQAGNARVNDSGRAAIAQELTGIRDAVIGLYNTRWLDRPVFGGTVSGQVAIDPADGSYQGNDADIVTRISRVATVRTDVKGGAVGADTLPDVLSQLAADVVAGSQTATANLAGLDAEIDKVIAGLGDVGSRAARVASAKIGLESEKFDRTARISEQEDIDIPETIMQLSAQQTAYQSALRAASQILQVSLVDFLR